MIRDINSGNLKRIQHSGSLGMEVTKIRVLHLTLK